MLLFHLILRQSFEILTVPIYRQRKWSAKRLKWLALGYTAKKWRSWDANPDLCDSTAPKSTIYVYAWVFILVISMILEYLTFNLLWMLESGGGGVRWWIRLIVRRLSLDQRTLIEKIGFLFENCCLLHMHHSPSLLSRYPNNFVKSFEADFTFCLESLKKQNSAGRFYRSYWLYSTIPESGSNPCGW